MSMKEHDKSKVDTFRIIYTDPSQDGRLNIFSCKYTNWNNVAISLSNLQLFPYFSDEHISTPTAKTVKPRTQADSIATASTASTANSVAAFH